MFSALGIGLTSDGYLQEVVSFMTSQGKQVVTCYLPNVDFKGLLETLLWRTLGFAAKCHRHIKEMS